MVLAARRVVSDAKVLIPCADRGIIPCDDHHLIFRTDPMLIPRDEFSVSAEDDMIPLNKC